METKYYSNNFGELKKDVSDIHRLAKELSEKFETLIHSPGSHYKGSAEVFLNDYKPYIEDALQWLYGLQIDDVKEEWYLDTRN